MNNMRRLTWTTASFWRWSWPSHTDAVFILIWGERSLPIECLSLVPDRQSCFSLNDSVWGCGWIPPFFQVWCSAHIKPVKWYPHSSKQFRIPTLPHRHWKSRSQRPEDIVLYSHSRITRDFFKTFLGLGSGVQGHLQNVTVPLSFCDSHMCRMLLNVWLDSTDEQESKWRDEWPITQQDTKDGNNGHHNKRIPSLNALPLLKCSREPLHFVTIQQYPLCINIILKTSFCYWSCDRFKIHERNGFFFVSPD